MTTMTIANNNDEFIFLQPKKNRAASVRARESVRVVFSKPKKGLNGYVLTIYLGKDLIKEMGLNASDKVAIGYDKNNPRRILIKKSDVGYTATEISGKNTPALRIMLKWQVFVPTDNDFSLKEVRHEVTDKGLIIIF